MQGFRLGSISGFEILVDLSWFIIFFHELIHGLAFAVFGGKPRYGVEIKFFLPDAYATLPGTRFKRNAFKRDRH